jgi:hypothetical protein
VLLLQRAATKQKKQLQNRSELVEGHKQKAAGVCSPVCCCSRTAAQVRPETAHVQLIYAHVQHSAAQLSGRVIQQSQPMPCGHLSRKPCTHIHSGTHNTANCALSMQRCSCCPKPGFPNSHTLISLHGKLQVLEVCMCFAHVHKLYIRCSQPNKPSML